MVPDADRGAVVPAARGQRRCVEGINGRAVRRRERNVDRSRGLAFQTKKSTLPGGPNPTAPSSRGLLDSEGSECGLVEPLARGRVTDSDGEMVDEGHGADGKARSLRGRSDPPVSYFA